MGSHIAYHFMVGKDGTVKQNRSLYERTMHTRNSVINAESIAIVVAGNFQEEKPSAVQLAAVRTLIKRLDATYHFKEIMPHHEASPTACAGRYLEEALFDLFRDAHKNSQVWYITRYYTPEKGQKVFFRKNYEDDFTVNCQGDCLVTADGYHLKPTDGFKVVACPPEIAFGTKMNIEGIGDVVCHDRGGAIKERRLDVWAGEGMDALRMLKRMPGGYLRVTFLKN